MPPACDELTFGLYVPITFQKSQAFGPQSRARLWKTFGFGTGDAIVRNDEVVGSIPTSSTMFSITCRLKRSFRIVKKALKRHVQPVAEKLGLPFVNWQCLRTSHATWLVQAGANPKSVQGQMRHSRISTTMDIYGAGTWRIEVFAPERTSEAVFTMQSQRHNPL